MPPKLSVKVWGEYACFTRPELKVERMSYPLMTPSAARGILESILWKPQMRWHVRRITVLRPESDHTGPPFDLVSFRRNEVQDKIAPRTVSSWINEPTCFQPYLVDSAGRDGIQGEHRTQRNTLALRNVCYRIDATPLLTELANQPRKRPPSSDEEDGPDSVAKYVGMFQRRVAKGQCFHHPYLGCREFVAHFAPPDGSELPMPWTDELGPMLYDLRFGKGGNVPGFFLAHVRDGVLHCDTRDPGPNEEPPIQVLGWNDQQIKEDHS